MPRGLARTMAQFARDLHALDGSQAVMQEVVDRTFQIVPGADYVSVSLLKGESIETVAVTDPVIHEVDSVQEQLQEGPCVDAAHGSQFTQVLSTHVDTQYPLYCEHARSYGIGATMGFQLALSPGSGGGSLGALNLYSRDDLGLSGYDREMGELIAAHATTAIAAAQLQEQLHEAIAGRDLIGQAKGLLMARLGLSSEASFELLVRQSKDTNTKLRDVAEQVVSQA